MLFPITLLILVCISHASAFGSKEPLSALLQKHSSEISKLKEEAKAVVGSLDSVPYSNDVFYLRYCLAEKGVEELKGTLAWRQGEGKAICEAACLAFAEATAGGKWNNEPVRNGAPNAATINKYITPDQCLTTTSSTGDLAYCVRAGMIDDAGLMSEVSSVDDLVQFFLYCKEINALVANDRSLETGKLLYVITANDLSGVKLIGGDSSFRDALSAASKIANPMFPELNGPTLLLNLPRLASALAKIFVPLLPKEVQARIKFERGPLSEVDSLLDINYGGKGRDAFLKDVDRLCYE
ncbi:MAG: hypothetical protein SGBAC_004965 [Bacillariaceae sp.]